MRETISAVMIAKNEAHQIERALKSLDWVDEIVVVDDGSQDQTAEISRQYTSKIIPHEFTGKISDTWRVGMLAATGDWLLLMDADEEVTSEFKIKVKKFFSEGVTKNYDGFEFYRNNWFLGEALKSGVWRSKTLRFFRKKGFKITSDLHLDIRVPGQVGVIEADINHYPFQTLEQFVGRQNFYSSMAIEDIRNEEGNVSSRKLLFQLTIRPLKVFYKNFLLNKGYRDGVLGYIHAVLHAFLHFIEWAKYWEKYRKVPPPKQL